MSKIRNIVFDIGHVLLEYRWLDLIREYVEDEEKAKRIRMCLDDDPYGYWNMYDKGLVTREEVIDAFRRKYPEEGEYIAWIFQQPDKMCIERPGIWEKVHQLKEKGYGIYLLSNYPKDLLFEHLKGVPFAKDVDGMVVSYMINICKPEPEIYQELFRKYQLKPEECVFFDDRMENVEGAVKMGMSAIQVVSEEQFLADMNIFL